MASPGPGGGYNDSISGIIPQFGAGPTNSEWTTPGGLYVCADGTSGFGTHRASLWTPGCTLVAPITLQQPPNEKWSINAWAVSINLAVLQWQDIDVIIGPTYYPVAPMFGKLGPVVTGLWANSSVNTLQALSNVETPYLTLPPDATFLETIFDPAVDALPPINFFQQQEGLAFYFTQNQVLPLTVSSVLSQSIDVSRETPISIVLTMLPSLIQNVELRVMSMTYTVKTSVEYAY